MSKLPCSIHLIPNSPPFDIIWIGMTILCTKFAHGCIFRTIHIFFPLRCRKGITKSDVYYKIRINIQQIAQYYKFFSTYIIRFNCIPCIIVTWRSFINITNARAAAIM